MDLRSQAAVAAFLKSKQLLLFGFARQFRVRFRNQQGTYNTHGIMFSLLDYYCGCSPVHAIYLMCIR